MRALFFACLVLLAACGAPAQSQHADVIRIGEPWASETPSGANVSAGYLTIINETAADDALIGVAAARAERAELHEMIADGAVMRMRAAPRLAVPAGEAVTLAPGGLHLMFYGLDAPFAAGEEIAVTLRFEHAGDVAVVLPVRARGGHGGH